MTVCHREFEMTVCHGEFEMTMCHQNMRKVETNEEEWFWNLLTKFHLSSLKSKKIGKNVHSAAPCAPTVRPLWALFCALLCRLLPVRPLLCNPMRNPLFWQLFHLGLFEIDLGYWSSKLKMSLGYWSSKRKRYWSSKSKMSLGYWSSAFFGPFCKGRFFFRGPVGRVPIKFFFCRGSQNLS